jgi:hypothetical protein
MHEAATSGCGPVRCRPRRSQRLVASLSRAERDGLIAERHSGGCAEHDQHHGDERGPAPRRGRRQPPRRNGRYRDEEPSAVRAFESTWRIANRVRCSAGDTENHSLGSLIPSLASMSSKSGARRRNSACSSWVQNPITFSTSSAVALRWHMLGDAAPTSTDS